MTRLYRLTAAIFCLWVTFTHAQSVPSANTISGGL